MNSKKLYFLLLGCAALLVLGLVGGAYGADKLLAARSKQLKDSRLEAAVLNQQQDQLVSAKRDVKKYQDLYTIAKSIVPQDKDQAQTVREIVNIAASNGITLSSVTFPSSTLGGSSSNGNGSTTLSKAAVASNSPQNKLSQLTPVKSIKGVYELPITVQSDATAPVPYYSFLNFLSDLENNRRTALVSTVTIQPSDANPQLVSFNLTLNEYIKP